MRYLILILLSVAPLFSVQAQGVATFSYQRGIVEIRRAQPPALPVMPWAAENTHAMVENSVVAFQVDIRPASSLRRQDGWMNMAALSDKHGIFFIFETPQVAQLGQLSYYQPADILWIDPYGMITSIAPNIILANNHAVLADKIPSKALLMLASGAAEKLSITPGDRVINNGFFAEETRIQTLAPAP